MAEHDESRDTHRCTICGKAWPSPPMIDMNGMHTDPHGDGCAGPIEFTPTSHENARAVGCRCRRDYGPDQDGTEASA